MATYIRRQFIKLGLACKDFVTFVPRLALKAVIWAVYWPIGYVKGLVFGPAISGYIEDKR